MSKPVIIPPAEVRQWTLPNGLELLVREDRSAAVASLQAWCRVGSIHEEAWLGAGLSHILEHMVFKGTTHREGPQIAREVQDAGGYINAYTTFDHTVYWIDAPAEGTMRCLDVLTDIVFHATLPEEEYEREQEVIRREFAMGRDNPGQMSGRLLFTTAFGLAPCRHPVIGHLEVFDQLTRQDVLEYYRRHYVPNNVFLVVVGDVDAEAVGAFVEERVGELPRRPLPPVYVPREPVQLGRRDAHVEFPTDLTRMHLSWHIPEVSHPDIPALTVLASVLGDGRSSRLYRRVREERSLVHSIGASTYTPAREGLISVSAVLEAERRLEAEGEILRVIDEVRERGVEEAEVEKARKGALADIVRGLATMEGQASDLGSNWLLTRNPHFTEAYFALLGRVTAEEVRRVAERYLVERTLTSVSLNPAGSLRMEAPAAAGPRREATRRWELGNGGTLLVGRDDRLPLVSLHAVFRAGLLADGGRGGLTRLAAQCLLKGTHSRTAAEIAEAIEAVGGSIGAEGGNNSLFVSLSVLPTDLDLALEILSDVLLHPAFPEEHVERERATLVAAIRAENDQPVTVACRRLRQELFPGHPYAATRNGTRETVAALGREDLEEFRRAYLVGSNLVLAVYGDVDPERVWAEAERRLAALPAGERAFGAPGGLPGAGDSREVEVELDKSQAVVVVGFRGVALADPDRLAAELLVEACSDMASRLFLRIREEHGLAYFVSASEFVGLEGGMLWFYLGTSPEKAELAEELLRREIRALSESGLEADEFERARQTYLGKLRIRNQSLGSLASVEALDELYGLGHGHHQETEARLRALTGEDVARVARRLLGEEAAAVRVRVAPPGQAGVTEPAEAAG